MTQDNNQPQKNKFSLPTLDKDDVRLTTILVDLLVCIVAAALVAGSLYYFSNYNHFAPGGVSGFAAIIAYLCKGDVSQNMSIFMLILNAPIFLLVALFVSRKTGIMLCVYLLSQSLLLILLKELHANGSIPYYGALPGGDCYEEGNNLIFASVGVGIISGFGFSLMLRRFGASGGTFAIAALIKRFKPAVHLAWFSFILDASVVGLTFFVYRDGINPVFCTLCNIFISDLVVDYMLQGLRSGYKFEIITDRADELSMEIMTTLKRGVTTLHAEGMYTHSDKIMLVCIIKKRQVGEFLKILKRYKAAFSYSCKVNEVYGKFEHDPHKK